MNVYPYEVTCDICGGLGVASPSTNAASWQKDSIITHKDPRTCIVILRQKAQEEV